MTHTDGLTERPPRITSLDYALYAHMNGRIGVWRHHRDGWQVDGAHDAERKNHPTFAAAWEHADQLVKETNR